jgi:nitrogen fixation/metabolism regulation signal transduction histidine kinase
MIEIERMAQPPKRRSRRYLVDARFQLKYTGLLVGVVLAVMIALGAVIWETARTASAQADYAGIQAERALEEARTSAKLLKSNAAQVDDPALQKSLEDDLAAIDREHEKNLADVKARRADVEAQRKKMALVLGVGSGTVLLVLLFMGIYITHKIVGPVYRMKRLLRQVGTARFSVKQRLRKGDELEDLFETFVQMAHSLESLQAGRRATLETTMKRAEKANVSPEVMAGLRTLHAQLSLGLGGGIAVSGPASSRRKALASGGEA